MAKKCVVHKDLAARNILISGERWGVTFVKISDFGLETTGYTLSLLETVYGRLLSLEVLCFRKRTPVQMDGTRIVGEERIQ